MKVNDLIPSIMTNAIVNRCLINSQFGWFIIIIVIINIGMMNSMIRPCTSSFKKIARRSTTTTKNHYNLIHSTADLQLLSLMQQPLGMVKNNNDEINQPFLNDQQKYRTVLLTRQSWIRQVLLYTSSMLLSWSTFIPTNTVTANAAETIGKDPNCNTANCLGIWDGLLANCDHTSMNSNPTLQSIVAKTTTTSAGCVSSQDDTPGTFAEPWDYSEDTTIDISNNDTTIQFIMNRIINAIQTISKQRGDQVTIVLQDKRYLHVLFTDQLSGEISDGEFYITPNDTTIQFRLSTSSSMSNSNGIWRMKKSLRNMDRAEMIRKELKWLKLPIIRNRKRTFLFIESDFDTFGPQSAALGPPEEMNINDINGR